MVNKHLQNTEN